MSGLCPACAIGPQCPNVASAYAAGLALSRLVLVKGTQLARRKANARKARR